MSASASADKVVCECCELCVPKQLASAIRNPYGLVRGWRCRICNEHQGQPVKMAQDHEEEVRIRWGETVDELHAALDRAGPRPGTWCTSEGSSRDPSGGSLGGQCWGVGGLLLGGFFGAGQCCSGSGEDLEAQVAPSFDPFVVLFGEDGSDEADDRGGTPRGVYPVNSPRAGRQQGSTGSVGCAGSPSAGALTGPRYTHGFRLGERAHGVVRLS